MAGRTERKKGKADKLVTSLPAKALVARLVRGRLSRTRAFLAAVAAAFAGAVLIYRLLRHGDDDE